MKHRSYKNLKVWQKADTLFFEICDEIKSWPYNTITQELTKQLFRAAGSVSANITEGYGRGTKKEFKHFLHIARGSAVEIDNWLSKAHGLKLISPEKYADYEGKINEIVKMLNSFMRTLAS